MVVLLGTFFLQILHTCVKVRCHIFTRPHIMKMNWTLETTDQRGADWSSSIFEYEICQSSLARCPDAQAVSWIMVSENIGPGTQPGMWLEWHMSSGFTITTIGHNIWLPTTYLHWQSWCWENNDVGRTEMFLLQHNTAGSDCLTNEFDVSGDNRTEMTMSWRPGSGEKWVFLMWLGVIPGYSWVLECKLDT